MTELESDYISDYYTVLNSYVFTNVDTTSSFRGISKKDHLKYYILILFPQYYF